MLQVFWRKAGYTFFNYFPQEAEGESANTSVNESLIEVLENIEESRQTTPKLSRQGSPMWNSETERITDYPVSNSPDSFLSRSPIHGSRSSSLSVSESSLTSEGSLSYDARRRPSKNILKKPHGPRRRSKNRVRWNLPNGEIDSDTTSLESFDSSSTAGSHIYQRARKATLELRQNWRDFEQSPNPGSTGLTPAKAVQARNQQNLVRSLSPVHGSSPLHTQLSPQRVPHITVSSSEELTGRGLRRSPSPLCNSPSPRNSPSPTPPDATSTLLQSPTKMRHSTPLRRYESDLGGASGRYSPQRRIAHNVYPGHKHITNASCSESPSNFINVPILKINESHIPELDRSTPGEKQRAHMFKIPQPHGGSRPQAWQYTQGQSNLSEQQMKRRVSEPVIYGNRHPPTAAALLKDDDDADDYDHLKPKEELQQSRKSPSPAKKEHVVRRQKAAGTKKRPPSGTYKDEDIDEALLELNGEDGYESESSSFPSPSDEQPPTIHPRGAPSLPQNDAHKSNNSPTPPVVPPRTTDSLSRELSHTVTHKGTSLASNSQRALRDDNSQPRGPPPPVPPRAHSMQHRSSREHHGHQYRGRYKPLPPLPEGSPSQSPTPESKASATRKATLATSVAISGSFTANGLPTNREGSQSPEVEDILPPPPEFSGVPPKQELANHHSNFSPSDDPLASISDTTLVAAEQGESSSHSLVYDMKIPLAKFNGVPVEQTREVEHRLRYVSSKGQASVVSDVPYQVQPDQYSSRNKLPWNPVSSAKLRDRGVRQLENTNGPSNNHHRHHLQEGSKLNPETRVIYIPNSGSDSSLDDPTVNKTTQTTIRQTRHVKPVSPEPTVTAESRTHLQAQRVQSPEPADISTSTTSPRHKVSMDHAYNEGNILQSIVYQSQPSQSPRSRQRRTSEQMAGFQGERTAAPPRLRRTTSSPHRPNPIGNDLSEHFSPEDQQVLQMFYSGGKPPMMKPVIHDTDRTIDRMLAELESEGSGDEKHLKKRPYGKLSEVYTMLMERVVLCMIAVLQARFMNRC